MNSLVILSERKAVARDNTLRQWLELESARARTVTADQHLLYASVAELVLDRGRAFETGRLGDAERHGAQRIARCCRAQHVLENGTLENTHRRRVLLEFRARGRSELPKRLGRERNPSRLQRRPARPVRNRHATAQCG